LGEKISSGREIAVSNKGNRLTIEAVFFKKINDDLEFKTLLV
jgi:hypothetical protein